MKARIILLTITLLLASCSPQQRLARLLRKHPQLVQDSIKTDSIIIHKTQFDTCFFFNTRDSFHSDTFTIEKPRFITQIIRTGGKLDVNTIVRDTVQIVRTHTKYITIPPPQKTFIERVLKSPIAIFIAAAATLLILYLFRRK